MMLLFKLVRMIGKLIRGGATPAQIFLASLLGLGIGMIPGLNLTLLLLIALVLVLNLSIGLVLFYFAIGKILCLALAPVTYRIGYAIIHKIGLEGIFRAASDTPVIALMDLHVYCLVGAIPVILVVGGAIGWLMMSAVMKVRKQVLSAVQSRERLQKLTQSLPARLLTRLLFGKLKVDLAQEMQRRAPLVRKSGVIFAAVVVVIALGAQWLLMSTVTKKAIVGGIEAAVGAETNVASARLSLLSGDLEIHGLQVTDPDKPAHNIIQADSLVGNVNVRDLLTKRFVIDELRVTAAASGVPRQSPGRVYEKTRDEAGPAAPAEPDSLDWYLKKTEDIQKYKRYLQKIKEYLEQQRAERERRKDELEQIARKRGYLTRSAQSILARHPAWTIRKLTVDKITVGGSPKPYNFDARELSSSPRLNPNPMKVSLNQDDGFLAAADFDFGEQNGMHKLVVHAPDVPLGKALKLSDNAPVDVSNGIAAIDLDGAFNADSLNLPVKIDVKNLQAQVREGKTVLG
ncbi:MAG TPA: hypothetical protein VM223_00450, partial [Planctomycetota bacterium]|nr:hypothetical protein [Planctomycetota bacterium]